MRVIHLQRGKKLPLVSLLILLLVSHTQLYKHECTQIHAHTKHLQAASTLSCSPLAPSKQGPTVTDSAQVACLALSDTLES